jgi:hypothetical protein
VLHRVARDWRGGAVLRADQSIAHRGGQRSRRSRCWREFRSSGPDQRRSVSMPETGSAPSVSGCEKLSKRSHELRPPHHALLRRAVHITRADVAGVVALIARRVERLLERRGLTASGDSNDAPGDWAGIPAGRLSARQATISRASGCRDRADDSVSFTFQSGSAFRCSSRDRCSGTRQDARLSDKYGWAKCSATGEANGEYE